MATKKLLPSLSVQWVFCCCLFYYRQMILVNIHYSQKRILVSYQTKVLRAGKKKNRNKKKQNKKTPVSTPALATGFKTLSVPHSPSPHPQTWPAKKGKYGGYVLEKVFHNLIFESHSSTDTRTAISMGWGRGKNSLCAHSAGTPWTWCVGRENSWQLH